ncbi:MAG TPA: threonine/serine exporter family protein [Spirochaetia bacterium]|jgi:uncharacterized membrane protein YjjP (DUF1212 family)|nr:threonine/serine exporter family protein [Spirochaetia bacterium]
MTARQLVPIAADLGAVLLRSGAEIRQVEEGLYRLFEARGMKAEVFVLLKGIFLSAWDEGNEPVSLIRHVRGGSDVDLARLERALVVAEALVAVTGADEARAQVAALETPGRARTGILVLAAAATAGIYGVFFGGTWPEALWAAGAAAGVQGLRGLGSRAQVPPLAEVFLSAVLLSLAGLAAPWVLPGADPVRVVTGGVMILIPGVALVNGVRDVLHGDTVSSLYRLAEAGLQTAAIAAGVALVLSWGWAHV